MGGGGEGLCRHVCTLVCYIDENMYVIMHMHKHDSVVSPYLPYKESGRETVVQLDRWTHSSSIRRRGGRRPVDVGRVVYMCYLGYHNHIIINA